MSWQNDIYQRLRDREWHSVGVLFEAIEQDIPLHTAMRRYLAPGNRQIPPNTEARWLSFKATLSIIGVEVKDGGMRGLRWDNKVRLSYAKYQQCQSCSGPVIKGGWSSRNNWVCLACENRPKPIVFPVEYTIPADLVSVTLPELGTWLSINAIVPMPMPKRRKRKRRAKARIQKVSTPRLVAPPVIRQSPTLVKTPKPVQPPPVKQAPPPKPKPEIPAPEPTTAIQEIWESFVLATPAPHFDQNPKLRRILHRALEAGLIDEYTRMKLSIENEMIDLRWPNHDYAGRVMGIRAVRWVEVNIREHQRKRWVGLLLQAYTAGSLAILALTVNGRLSEISKEVERLISIKLPKPREPNKAPQPVRQRWGAPFRQARNVVSRWFNR